MTTSTSIILSPAQFVAARALAAAHYHLWASVPDGTYNLADIETWSLENADLMPGIARPYVDDDDVVVHTTGTGRLSWRVDAFGNVTLSIFRPDPKDDEEGIEVARVQAINDNLDRFEIGENDLVYAASHGYDDTGRHMVCDESLRDDIIFERHVEALVRPLVALLTANEPEGNDYEQHREQVIEPAIAKAKAWLAPLYAKASPDPLYAGPGYDLRSQIRQTIESPETTGWVMISPRWKSESESAMSVWHRGECFPVESERTAAYAVLLLRQQPEMPLVEAVKAAIVAKKYRPSAQD